MGENGTLDNKNLDTLNWKDVFFCYEMAENSTKSCLLKLECRPGLTKAVQLGEMVANILYIGLCYLWHFQKNPTKEMTSC